MNLHTGHCTGELQNTTLSSYKTALSEFNRNVVIGLNFVTFRLCINEAKNLHLPNPPEIETSCLFLFLNTLFWEERLKPRRPIEDRDNNVNNYLVTGWISGIKGEDEDNWAFNWAAILSS